MKHSNIDLLISAEDSMDMCCLDEFISLIEESQDILGTIYNDQLFVKKALNDFTEAKLDLKNSPRNQDLIENVQITKQFLDYINDKTIKLAIHTGDTEILEYMEDQGIPYSHFSDRSSAKEYAIENGNTEIQAFYVNMFKRMAEKLGECNQALIRQNLFVEQKKSQIARIEMKAALAIAQTNEEVIKEIDSTISDMYSKVAI